MNAKAEKLLDAHVAFEMEQLKEENFKAALEKEVKVVWKWLGKKKFGEIVKKKDIKDFLERNVKDQDIPEAWDEYLASVNKVAIKYLKKDETKLGTLIKKDDFEALVDQLVENEKLREELIGKAVGNPLYAELLTNILYNGIKSFTSSEDGMTGKIPGASSFLKFGQGMLKSAMPDLEDNIDKSVRKFIESNIKKSIKTSEKFLRENLNEKNLKLIARQGYGKMKGTEVKELMKHIKAKDVNKMIPTTNKITKNFRDSDFVKNFVDMVLDHLEDYTEEKTVKKVLEDLEITKKKVIREAHIISYPIVEQLVKDGLIEERIRERLKKFYSSEATEKILD